MGVGGHGPLRRGDQQAPGHAQMDNPFRLRRGRGRFGRGSFLRGSASRGFLDEPLTELADDVFADSLDREDETAFDALRLLRGRSFEGLGMGTEPGLDDAVAAEAEVDAAGDGFHFGQFGHSCILVRIEESNSVFAPADW